MPPTRFADAANASGQVTTASGRTYGRRPPMPPPAPPRAPAQQAYASANPNASFQRAPARPPLPPVRAQTLPAYGSANATTEQGRPVATGPQYAMGAQARTLPAPAAYANANPNAAFQGAMPPAWQQAHAMDRAGDRVGAAQMADRLRANPAGATAADMVDVPGFGPMPRSLLTALQSRMQQRQQPPPVRAMPADNRYTTPYGNDNIGVGVVPPTPMSPPPAAPPPPSVPLNPLTMTPNGQQMVAGGAANLAQQQVTSPTPTSAPPGNPNDYWWDGTKGAWQYIDRAAEAAARNAAMVPPAPPVSPIAGHLWGGGSEAFGAGRSPVATSMTDFYGAFGSGIPGQPVPTQQQLYDRFNANPTNPYMQAGAVNNGNTVFPQPSWY